MRARVWMLIALELFLLGMHSAPGDALRRCIPLSAAGQDAYAAHIIPHAAPESPVQSAAQQPPAPPRIAAPGWVLYPVAQLHTASCMADASVGNSYCLYRGRPVWFFVYRASTGEFGTLYAAVATLRTPRRQADWKYCVISRNAALPVTDCTISGAAGLTIFYYKIYDADKHVDLMSASTTALSPVSATRWRTAVVRKWYARAPDNLPQITRLQLWPGQALVYCIEDLARATQQVHYLSTTSTQAGHSAVWRHQLLGTCAITKARRALGLVPSPPKFELLLCHFAPLIVQSPGELQEPDSGRIWWAARPHPARAADWRCYRPREIGMTEVSQVCSWHDQPLVIGKLYRKLKPAGSAQPLERCVPCLWLPARPGQPCALQFAGVGDVKDSDISAGLSRDTLCLLISGARVVFACVRAGRCLHPAAWHSYELFRPAHNSYALELSLWQYQGSPLVTYLLEPSLDEGDTVYQLTCIASKKRRPLAKSDWRSYTLCATDILGADYSSFEQHLDWAPPALGTMTALPDKQDRWEFFLPRRANPASRADWRRLTLPDLAGRNDILAPLSSGYGVHYVSYGPRDERMRLYFGVRQK